MTSCQPNVQLTILINHVVYILSYKEGLINLRVARVSRRDDLRILPYCMHYCCTEVSTLYGRHFGVPMHASVHRCHCIAEFSKTFCLHNKPTWITKMCLRGTVSFQNTGYQPVMSNKLIKRNKTVFKNQENLKTNIRLLQLADIFKADQTNNHCIYCKRNKLKPYSVQLKFDINNTVQLRTRRYLFI